MKMISFDVCHFPPSLLLSRCEDDFVVSGEVPVDLGDDARDSMVSLSVVLGNL